MAYTLTYYIRFFMIAVSVVIITKNEAEIIGSSISKARLITDDIVVIDNGSTDNTSEIALEMGCRVYQKNWESYAANKNKGITLAKYDWILSIDADEVPDDELIKALHQLKLDKPDTVYDIKFKSYFGKKLIRFGKWGRDHHIRLFNRTLVQWQDSPVHETLLLPHGIKQKRIAGNLHHYSVNNNAECQYKAILYAKLSAKSYYNNGKKATFVKQYISPAFNFIKNYIVYLGFLDGEEGLAIAQASIKHTRLKYYFLKKMELADKKKEYAKNRFTYVPQVDGIKTLT